MRSNSFSESFRLYAGFFNNLDATCAVENSKFLYTYNDNNAYEYCSYEQKYLDNPLIEEFLKLARFSSLKK